jgi:hypothetical protein
MTESPVVNRWIESGQVKMGREWLLDCLRTRFRRN